MDKPDMDFDIAIIGAGPAGATCALFLAQMGIPHLLLDAAAFPRDKVCGDGLDLKVVRVLNQLESGLAEKLLGRHPDVSASHGARLIAPNGRTTEFIHAAGNAKPLVWLSKRLHFDNMLVERLDARCTDFRTHHKLLEAVRTEDGWQLHVDDSSGLPRIMTCRLLVGADGDHSAVLRSLGQRAIDRRHYAGAVRQYWKGVHGLHEKNLIEVYFPPGLPLSYFYLFPLPDGEVNVGYGMVSEAVSKGRYNLRELMHSLIHKDPVMARRFQGARPLEEPTGWGLPLASQRRSAHGDGYLLLGDAASLICPTSGEGIGTAMMSGYIAAHFIRRAYEKGQYDSSLFRHFEREIHRRLRDEITLYNVVIRRLPGWTYDRLLNALVPTKLLQAAFAKRAPGWLETAYEKKIEVEVE